MARYTKEESAIVHFLFADTRMAWVWLVLRVYLGWEWLTAGWEKVTNPDGAWVGAHAGAALTGFLNGALKQTAAACDPAKACHPNVQDWYAWFTTHVALPNVTVFSYLVAYGEVLVGLALILGFLVGISAMCGMFMNLNFMLAGSLSVNATMFVMGLVLTLAWRAAGYIGLDRYALPILHKVLRSRNLT